MSETLDHQPVSDGRQQCWLPPSRRSPRVARQALRGLLAKVAGGERFLETGELLLSEVVTNAVTHGAVRGRLVLVDMHVDRDRLRVDVHDASADRLPTLREVTEDDESGRGLMLVKSLSSGWGCCSRAPGFGKVTWFEINEGELPDQ